MKPILSTKTFLTTLALACAMSGYLTADTGADHKAVQPRPIALGTSGGNINDRSTLYCCSGTLGALVQDANGLQYILSNNHVLAMSNGGIQGDSVNQPGQIDQNCRQDGIVADLSNFVEIKFGKGRNLPANEVDAAIAQVRPGQVRPDGAIIDIGTVSGETASATVGQTVQKSGRTTGHTTGSVSAIDVTVDVAYSADCGGAANQKARFVNQIRITPGTFSAGGDSGSVIFESGQTPHAVGLLFAGSTSSTIANPIDRVLSLLGVSMVGGEPIPVVVGDIAGTVTDASGNAIFEATVSTDSGQSATTDSAGSYTITDVPVGDRTVTASALGHVSASETVTVVDGGTATANFALEEALAASQSLVNCVTFSTSGGKNADRHLTFTIRVTDDFDNPVSGATVNISVTRNGSLFGNGSGALSNDSGEAAYEAKNAADGTYVVTVTAVEKAGLTFEGTTPVNSFAKGTDSSPASFGTCEGATGGEVAANGNGRAGFDRARLIKSRHSDALLGVEDVVGHGLGAENGRPVIEIYLQKENAASRARIPAHLENVPVRVVVTGPFTAF